MTMMPPPPGTSSAPSRVNWMALSAAFVSGALVASFAWVGLLDSRFDPQAAADSPGRVVPRASGEFEGEDDAADAAGGPRTRTIEERVGGDDGGEGRDGEQGGPGGVALGAGGGPGDGPGGSGGSGGSDAARGVAENTIKLGATVVRGGIAQSFLGEVEFGMEAVRERVNAAGGIHGRNLEIDYQNDDWDAGRGLTRLQNLINDGVFALAVSPSSEGLNAASNQGLFERHGVPVVGADGLNNTQFLDPWIWPVAAATTTQAHVIMKDAWDRCEADPDCSKAQGGPGLQPAIVFGNTYRFGVEGAFAFNGAYCRLTGGTFTAGGECQGGENLPGFRPGGAACDQGSRFCGVDARPGQSYPTEVSLVNDACRARDGRGACNFVLLLLEPATAQSWMRLQSPSAEDLERDGDCCGLAGAQPLFTENFATNCGNKCNRMRVWTGYNPPIGRYLSEPAVQRYEQELRARRSRADVNNQFTLGGYVGMTLLVDALELVGPNLTREALVQALNSMPALQTGLTNGDGLRWTAGQRYANHSAQAFRIDFQNTFNGFRFQTDYTRDPWLGQDNRLPGQ